VKFATDTSVIVASFASWHESHEIGRQAVARAEVVIAHCLLETYSVLTRLPAPHRATAEAIAEYFRTAFAKLPVLALAGSEHRKLLATCIAKGVVGGAIYDAVIAATCTKAGVKLVTLDARARATYVAIGVTHELLEG
jgi:predicted nucleic acid-binding protein